MLGVTTYLTTEIAPVPLLWVLPLALYLLSFIVVFGRPPAWIHRGMVLALPVVLVGQALLMAWGESPMRLAVPAHLVTFFVAAMVCHGELARARPAARFLTEFYLWVALGGVLGGLFNALLAPLVFRSLAEYPLALVAAALLMPAPASAGARGRLLRRVVPVAVAVVVGGIFAWHWARGVTGLLHAERSFFGVLRVLRGSQGRTHTFTHGSVRHGVQIVSTDPRPRRRPLLYYFPTGPIGQVFAARRGRGEPVAVVGLGVGSVASYGEAGQEFTFFEIDPAVERVARDPAYFTFLRDAQARGVGVRVVLGDARLSLRRQPPRHYGLIVLDAFSGDAVPTHLLTREALWEYLDRLAAGGVLAFHITNDYMDLRPVLAGQARDAGLVALVQDDGELSEEEVRLGKASSTWVVMARRREDLGALAGDSRWQPLARQPGAAAWTDDYANVLQVLRWK
jgi:hypothetical protein